ncbi:MAG: hypothetical protein MK135_16585, partial [Polyangiaceae bacterium]|nr:hypothetical protein [Polyangiaceae bacterium]
MSKENHPRTLRSSDSAQPSNQGTTSSLDDGPETPLTLDHIPVDLVTTPKVGAIAPGEIVDGRFRTP